MRGESGWLVTALSKVPMMNNTRNELDIRVAIAIYGELLRQRQCSYVVELSRRVRAVTLEAS